MPVQNGLPHATRTFRVSYTLRGVAATPTTIQGELYRNVKGRPFVVQTLSGSDFNEVVEGTWEVTVQPDTFGDFKLRVWTSGDAQTDDIKFDFNVPAP